MKTIIAGSRSISDFAILGEAVLYTPWTITHVVSGGARGVDKLGELYAKLMGVPLTVMAANWIEDGRAAGIIRNRQMLDVSEALIALWDGSSKGTHNMMSIALKKKIPTVIYDISLGTIGVIDLNGGRIDFPLEEEDEL